MTAEVAPDIAHRQARGVDGTAPARQWLPGLVVLAAIWGSQLPVHQDRRGGDAPGVPDARAGRLRHAGAAVVLLVARERLPRSGRVWMHLNIVSAFGVVLPFTLFGYGEQRITSVLAGIWNAATPLVVLPVAALVFRTERFTARKIAGVALGFARRAGGARRLARASAAPHLTGQLMCFAAAVVLRLRDPVPEEVHRGRAAVRPVAHHRPVAGRPPPSSRSWRRCSAGAPPALGALSLRAVAQRARDRRRSAPAWPS